MARWNLQFLADVSSSRENDQMSGFHIQLHFGYNVLHKTQNIILSATLEVSPEVMASSSLLIKQVLCMQSLESNQCGYETIQ